MKFTPGPWECNHDQNIMDGCNYVISSKDSDIAFTASWMGEESKHNAHLIAAAPDLLEACKGIIEWFDMDKEPANKTLQRFENLRKAIQKAEGR